MGRGESLALPYGAGRAPGRPGGADAAMEGAVMGRTPPLALNGQAGGGSLGASACPARVSASAAQRWLRWNRRADGGGLSLQLPPDGTGRILGCMHIHIVGGGIA